MARRGLDRFCGGVNLQVVEARERAEAASAEPWAAMGIVVLIVGESEHGLED